LDGSKNYKLNIPANPPAKDFWSVILYDPQTRSELQTGQPYPNKNSKRDDLVENADGSVDLYIGPTPPAGEKKTGFRLFRANRGTRACASTARLNHGSTRLGSREKSNW
jgi:hypothetical protein